MQSRGSTTSVSRVIFSINRLILKKFLVEAKLILRTFHILAKILGVELWPLEYFRVKTFTAPLCNLVIRANILTSMSSSNNLYLKNFGIQNLSMYLGEVWRRILPSTEVGETPDGIPRHGQTAALAQKPVKINGRVKHILWKGCFLYNKTHTKIQSSYQLPKT